MTYYSIYASKLSFLFTVKVCGFCLANRERIENNHDVLEEFLEHQFGYLDKLYSTRVLTHEQVTEVRTPPTTFYKHNDRLLEILRFVMTSLNEKDYR